jgi:hypothetical protein
MIAFRLAQAWAALLTTDTDLVMRAQLSPHPLSRPGARGASLSRRVRAMGGPDKTAGLQRIELHSRHDYARGALPIETMLVGVRPKGFVCR